ncbi:Anhydro-N-acetylmuramic acid kinase [hydrothermal vent metagenome]|uniref:Anhydro-N-acetylmuramic acid kinase n=1 Tax=hydrothermal vent metagenome TaxID=652676 RepID=A0A3B1ADG1_9ZZZZ
MARWSIGHEYYIGLMSGTSLDGIDAVLVDFTNGQPRLIEAHTHPLPDALHQQLTALCQPGDDEIERMGRADMALGELFADAVQQLLSQANLPSSEIHAIGSHGQTIRHRPDAGFTLQIGDANRIAQHTGITTVTDFRRRDMAAGGQGAPLVPAFHAALFRSPDITRVVLNLGGMANITLLPADPEQPVSGYDTGPGNVLMDAWARQHLGRPLDESGTWAATGCVDEALLTRCLRDVYFRQLPPKSTGREYFNAGWLATLLSNSEGDHSLSSADVQATLCELTAISVAEAIRQAGADATELLVCGGGVHNAHLLSRLGTHLDSMNIIPSNERGLAADWVEAVAFAWLARETLAGRPGNLPAVTGASEAVVLGAIYPGRN